LGSRDTARPERAKSEALRAERNAILAEGMFPSLNN